MVRIVARSKPAAQRRTAPGSETAGSGAASSLLRRWWLENSKFAGIGVVVVAVGVGGWQWWNYQREAYTTKAAEQYDAFIVRLESHEPDENDGAPPELLPDKYADTPYLAFAYLRRAQYFVEQGEFAEAADDLRWVAENAIQSVVSQLAYIRLARVLLALEQMEQTEEVLRLLDQPAFSLAATALVDEIRGDVFLKLNQKQAARTAYESVWRASRRPTDFLRMKAQHAGQTFVPPLEEYRLAAPVQ